MPVADSLLQAKSNGRILFYLYDGFTAGVSGLFTINPDGSGQQRLPDLGRSPVWSPDGTRLAYFLREEGARIEDGEAIFVSAPDGTNKRRVATFAASNENTRLAWSPDGAKIIFVTFGTIWAIHYDGSNLTQVTRPPTIQAQAFAPEWQPLPTSGAPQPLPDTQTFIIRGRITNEEGRPFNAAVRLSGSLTGLAVGEDPPTGAEGVYTAVRLPRGGNYPLTPESLAYRFEPPSRNYNDLTANVTDADFKAFFRPLSIRRRITDSAGLPLAGVPFIFGANFSPVETDERGIFAFTNLFGGAGYSLRPLGHGANDLFDPLSAQFHQLTENKVVNFVGRREKFEVTCQVVDAAGQPMPEVTVTLNSLLPGNNVTRTATTDSNGKCSFADVTGGFVYSFKASKTGLSFAPAAREVIVNRPTEVLFMATRHRRQSFQPPVSAPRR